MIVASLTFASWHRGQSYCWNFAPLRLSMWLINIDEKGWLLQAQSHALIAINRCCSLQYKVKILTVTSSAMAVPHILYHWRFGAFTIIVVVPTSIQRMLVVAWHDLAFPCRYQTCCAIL
jgi:hypothetical protein